MKSLFASLLSFTLFFSPLFAHESLDVPFDTTWSLSECCEDGKTEVWTRGEERMTLMTYPLEPCVTMDQVLHFAKELMYEVDLHVHEKSASHALISALTPGKALLICKLILKPGTIHIVHYSYLGDTAQIDREGVFSLIQNTYVKGVL